MKCEVEHIENLYALFFFAGYLLLNNRGSDKSLLIFHHTRKVLQISAWLFCIVCIDVHFADVFALSIIYNTKPVIHEIASAISKEKITPFTLKR